MNKEKEKEHHYFLRFVKGSELLGDFIVVARSLREAQSYIPFLKRKYNFKCRVQISFMY